MRFFQAVLAASLPVDSAGRVQLLPAGEFAARDGRPGPGKKWKLTDAQGAVVAAALAAVAAQTPVVIDYDHQTLHALTNGQKAPAAGWIKGAEWLNGQGLFAPVQWTAAAKASIDAGEYAYISPVITYSEDGTVQGVALAALTNFPALLGMQPVISALSTQFQQEPTMNPILLALLSGLGLAENATLEQATAALTTLKTERDTLKAKPPVPAALATALGLQATADENAALTAVRALKGGDANLVGLVTALQAQVAQLTAAQNDASLIALVDGALTGDAPKFLPAMREQLLAIGRSNRAQLQALIDAAVPLAGLAGQTGGKGPAGDGTAALAGDAVKLIAGFGLTPEQFAKGKTATP